MLPPSNLPMLHMKSSAWAPCLRSSQGSGLNGPPVVSSKTQTRLPQSAFRHRLPRGNAAAGLPVELLKNRLRHLTESRWFSNRRSGLGWQRPQRRLRRGQPSQHRQRLPRRQMPPHLFKWPSARTTRAPYRAAAAFSAGARMTTASWTYRKGSAFSRLRPGTGIPAASALTAGSPAGEGMIMRSSTRRTASSPLSMPAGTTSAR